MFDVILDYIKKLLKSRIFPITIIYMVLFGVVIGRLFELQIVNGTQIAQEGEVRDTEVREIDSTRANIYDRKGELLASNALTYSVVMEDSTKIESNEQRNAIVYKLIKILEKNKDTLDNEFYIELDSNGNCRFTVEDTALTRFKKTAYTYLKDKNGEIPEELLNSSAEEVFEFLRSGGDHAKETKKMFDISDTYSKEEALKIMGVRFALFNVWPKYIQINIASKVSDKTIAAVEENSAELIGVEIKQQTHRVYEDSVYFSNIIGYTGLISSEQLELYNENEEIYNLNDIVGQTGLEKKFEKELRGKKGSETVSVNTVDKVIDIIDRIDPVSGDDIYLTIDKELQISSYRLLEKELASILLEKITQDMDYGSKGESANEILIPIYEVYYALINNNIIDINHFYKPDATTLEKQVYEKYQLNQKDVLDELDSLLSYDNKLTNSQAGDMEEFLDYFYSLLISNEILMVDNIPDGDTTLAGYKDGKISLSSLLQHALANNWIDIAKLKVGDEFYKANELYQKLISYTKDILMGDGEFNKKIYRNLVFSYKLSGSEICLLLFDQGVLEYNEDEVKALKNNLTSAYSFITGKIKSLDITPAMLALEPCSGSIVVTDVKTGDVLALVSYPGYDNNKFVGKVDSAYFNKLNNDLSRPLTNKPTSDRISPGSTFKMVTAVAALEEGITTYSKEIYDYGEYTNINPAPKCHAHPGSHGSVNIVDALAVSCNYYFFDMGFRLSLDRSGLYNSQIGLSKLDKYASMFGLNEKSGLELGEAMPYMSDTDSVRSSIGQGSFWYSPTQLARYVTTIANRGTCYNLTLIDKIAGKDGKIIKDNSATVNKKLDEVSSSTWNAVLEGMNAVTNREDGSVVRLFKDLGVNVAGKTGTSQISKSVPNNALFVSFAPYEDPEVSVTVVIPNGYTSYNAAEVSKNIYSIYFERADEETVLNSEISKSQTNIDAAIE